MLDNMKNHLYATLAAFGLASFEHVETVLKCVALAAAIVVSVLDHLRRSRRKVYPRAKKKLPVVVPLLFLLAGVVSGCSTAGTADVVKALGSDTNHVRVELKTLTGSVTVERN